MLCLLPASEIASMSTKLFVAAGAGERESRIASEWLITSSLMGHDSHGVMRIPEYLEFRTLRQRVPDGIPVDDATLAAMRDQAKRLRVEFKIASLPF
jgi:LDH2 family malate/lactate/ureidoglycolate dehydrogenase